MCWNATINCIRNKTNQHEKKENLHFNVWTLNILVYQTLIDFFVFLFRFLFVPAGLVTAAIAIGDNFLFCFVSFHFSSFIALAARTIFPRKKREKKKIMCRLHNDQRMQHLRSSIREKWQQQSVYLLCSKNKCENVVCIWRAIEQYDQTCHAKRFNWKIKIKILCCLLMYVRDWHRSRCSILFARFTNRSINLMQNFRQSHATEANIHTHTHEKKTTV